MKQLFLFRFGSLVALLVCLLARPAMAQERPMTIAYDADKQAYIAHEIIVRFNPALVKTFAVDNLNLQSGTLSSFVQPAVCEQMSHEAGVDLDFSQVATFKIFYHMTSADTLSVSRLGDTVSVAKLWSAFVLQLPDGLDEQAVCNSLSNLFPTIIYAHRNLAFGLNQTNPPTVPLPNDVNLGQQSNLLPTTQYPNANINMRPAWQVAQGSNSVKVGVFDSGIDAAHPDFNNGPITGTVVTGGRNYINNTSQSGIVDTYGHGTACAGIIGARRNNAVGISGIAGGNYGATPIQPGVQLYDMKVLLDFGGLIPVSAAAAAVAEGAAQSLVTGGYGFGLHVMSNSWSGPLATKAAQDLILFREALFSAAKNKTVFVASKGNTGTDEPMFPSDLRDDWVLSVGASGSNGQYKDPSNGLPNGPCPFTRDNYSSSYANGVDLIAPGSIANVYTTRSRAGTWNGQCPATGDYTVFDGTSAAAPHAAGVAALLLQYTAINSQGVPEGLAPEDVEQIMQRTATDKAPINASAPYDDLTGWGLLNAGGALNAVRGSYRLVHDQGYAYAFSTLTTSQPIVLSDPYSTSLSNLRAGVTYNATVDQAIVHINPQSLLGFGEQIVGVWVRNSSSVLWGPVGANNVVSPYPGMTINPGWTATDIQAVGYRYSVNNTGFDMPGYDAISGLWPVRLTYWVYSPNTLPFRPGGSSDSTAVAAKSVLYPNPGTSAVALTCTLPQGSQHATVEFINSLTGRVTRKFSFNDLLPGSQTLSLDVRELTSGLYTYRLITDDQVQTGRFAKE